MTMNTQRVAYVRTDLNGICFFVILDFLHFACASLSHNILSLVSTHR